MIAISVSTAIPGDTWVSQVLACGGNPLHLPSTLLVDHRAEELRYFTFREGTQSVGWAIAVASARRRWKLGSRGAQILFPTAPAMMPEFSGSPSQILESLVQFCRNEGYARLHLDGRWGFDFSGQDPWARSVVRTSIDFCLRLQRPIEDILAGMNKYHRKNIRRAERLPIRVVEDSSLDALLSLRALQVHSATRASERATGFAVPDPRYFARLHEHLYQTGVGTLLMAYLDDAPVAALASLVAGKKAITVRSGANEEGYQTFAMYLLHLHLFQRLLDRAIEEVNIGAVPAEATSESHAQHGLYLFKDGFGGTPHVRTTVEIDL